MLLSPNASLHKRRQSSTRLASTSSGPNLYVLFPSYSFLVTLWIKTESLTSPGSIWGAIDNEIDPEFGNSYVQAELDLSLDSTNIVLKYANAGSTLTVCATGCAWVPNNWYFVGVYNDFINPPILYTRPANGHMTKSFGIQPLWMTTSVSLYGVSQDPNAQAITISGMKQFGISDGQSTGPIVTLTDQEVYLESLQLSPVSPKCISYVPFENGKSTEELHKNFLFYKTFANTSTVGLVTTPYIPPIPEYLSPSRKSWFLSTGTAPIIVRPYVQNAGLRIPASGRGPAYKRILRVT